MDAEDHFNFLEKYAAGRHSELEHEAFRQWLLEAPPEQVRTVLDQYDELQRQQLLAPPPEIVAVLEARLDGLAIPTAIASARRWLWAVAASVALLLGIGRYLLPGVWLPTVAYQQHQTGLNQTTPPA